MSIKPILFNTETVQAISGWEKELYKKNCKTAAAGQIMLQARRQ